MRLFTKKGGFSLVEVLAGLLIFAGLISLFVQLSYGSARRLKKARRLDKIAGLLEMKMKQLEEEFRGERIANLPDQKEGEFKDQKNYFWSYKTQPFALPPADIILSLAQIPDNELNQKMAQALANVLSETAVELELTVAYKGKRGRDLRYSLVSYFINYEDAPDFIFKHISGLMPEGGL